MSEAMAKKVPDRHRFKRGNTTGTQWKKGCPSPNPLGGKLNYRHRLKKLLDVSQEDVEVVIDGKPVTMSNQEVICRRFINHLKTADPFDVQAFRVYMEYTVGKPREIDADDQRSPEEFALSIKIALDKMNVADGIMEPMDTIIDAGGADDEMVALAEAPGGTALPAQPKKIQRRSRGKKKLQDRDS